MYYALLQQMIFLAVAQYRFKN